MAKTFACPHCDNTYPILPTLVGRKVRCTYCKNAFQLQYDGIATKVGVAKAAPDDPALERDQDAPQLTREQSVPKMKPGTRPQTKAIKRHTERIKQIRTSLQDAAQQAVESVSQEQSTLAEKERLTSGTKDVQSSRPGSVDRQHSVVLTNNEERQRRVNKMLFLIILILAGSIYLLSVVFTRSIEQKVLDSFCQELSEDEMAYPMRLNTYYKRMSIYTRDGVNHLPVILNIDDAHIVGKQVFDWTEVIAACSPELDDLVMNRALAMWHLESDQELIHTGWQAYANKVNLLGFYEQLERKKIRFVPFERFRSILIKKGISKEMAYVLSTLLAGTADAHGSPCPDYGLLTDSMPSKVQLVEFTGKNGNQLLDAGGYYSSSSMETYCGIIVGFTDFTGLTARDDQWAIFDVRDTPAMRAYYAAAHDPLQHLASLSHDAIRREQFALRRASAEPIDDGLK